jgi:histidinol-phosphate phosphatase family protein
MRKAVFLDKDGVINSLVQREDGRMTSPWTFQEFMQHLDPHLSQYIKTLKELGYVVFVVTNQPGVLDGDMYITELDDICGFLEDDMGILHVLYALKKDTNLYKPNNGMIEALIGLYSVDREHSFMVGDRWKDIVAGKKSELTTIYVNENPYTTGDPDDLGPNYKVASLGAAVDLIYKIGW